MQRYNFFFRQKVTEAELDAAFDACEQALFQWALDNGVVGVTAGGDVAENAGTPNLTVDVSGPASIYDQSGQRVNWTGTQDIDCSVDENSNPTAVTTPGNEKYLSLFAKFVRSLSDARLDGEGASVFFDRAESFQINVAQGAESAAPATPPTLRGDEILLADIKLIYGQTQILNADISTTRRQNAIKTTSGTPVSVGQVEEAIQILADAIEAVESATGVAYGGGPAWHDGTTNPATTIEAQLDKIVSDLVANAGSDRIGSAAQTVGPISVAVGSIKDQLGEVLAELDRQNRQLLYRDISLLRKRKEAMGTAGDIYGIAFGTVGQSNGTGALLMAGVSGVGVLYAAFGDIVGATTDRTSRLVGAPDGLYDVIWIPGVGGSGGRFIVAGERPAAAGAEVQTNDDLIAFNWTQRTPTGMTTGGDIIYALCHDTDNDFVIACGANGKFIKSGDYGATWSAASSLPGGIGSLDFLHLAHNGQGTVIAVGHDGSTGVILRSTDGGDTWTDVSPVDAEFIRPRNVVYEPAADRFVVAAVGTVSQVYWWRATTAAATAWTRSTLNNPDSTALVADGSGNIAGISTLGKYTISPDLGVTAYGGMQFENNPDGNTHGAAQWENGVFLSADPQRAYFKMGRIWVPDGVDLWVSPARGPGWPHVEYP